jgi:hypothetical protein
VWSARMLPCCEAGTARPNLPEQRRSISPGETVDAIFVAPPHSGGEGTDRYMFYNRNFHRLNNGGHTGYGGQMTEIHVYPSGTLPEQGEPNT